MRKSPSDAERWSATASKRPRFRRRLVARLAVLALPLALTAIIAPPIARGSPCTASVEEARRHMDLGLSFFDKKRFAKAATEFDAAYQAQPYSAFLCNAAMAYQEALDFPNAIARYKAFLAAEPNPPDLPRIKAMLTWLVAQHAARLNAHGPDADAGAEVDASDADAGAAAAIPADGGTPPNAGVDTPPPAALSRSIRSQVVVESDPPGAPLTIYARSPGAAPFRAGAPNPGWEIVVDHAKTPHDVALGIGDYHLVLDAFRDYKRSETDLSLAPGRVYAFKANLSQGSFLGFLRVTSPVEGARIFLDDPPPHAKGPWGRTPYSDLLDTGEHRLWVEAPGYLPFSQVVVIEQGKTMDLAAVLSRVPYGFVVVDGNAEEISVNVDGVPYGNYSSMGEPLRIKLPAGPHKVVLDASGRKALTTTIDVPAGREIAVHASLSSTPPRSNALVSGALAVGAAVGGVVMLQQPGYRFTGVDFYNRPILEPTGTQPWFKIGGFVSLGVSGLLAAVTVYTLVHDPNPPSSARLEKPNELEDTCAKKQTGFRVERIAPAVGSRGGGLEVIGTF